MKRLVLLVSILFLILMGSAHASSFNSGSTGADGAFNPTQNIEVQLPPNGIFNFTTVNIPAGVTVTFKKNAANTPVYILATGDVIIEGTIDVSGGNSNGALPGRGGPGGFDGGYGGGLSNSGGGDGLGPGGGRGGYNINCSRGGGGGFATTGASSGGCNGSGGVVYGNSRLIPLIGGSGGGGSADGFGGGGGGGAILIASSSTITVNGNIKADGGIGKDDFWCDKRYGQGSGGAVKLIANIIKGNGLITARGALRCGNGEGQGRIRLEAFTNNRTAGTDPPYTYGLPGSVFPATTPVLRITSIAGVNVPTNPTGSYSQPDIMLPSTATNPVTVNISASNIPVGTTVKVLVIPQYGASSSVDATLSGTESSSTASANVNLSTQYSNIIMAQATYTLQTAMYYEGEKIDKVKVASTIGGESEAVYISESGREIKADELIIAGLLIK